MTTIESSSKLTETQWLPDIILLVFLSAQETSAVRNSVLINIIMSGGKVACNNGDVSLAAKIDRYTYSFQHRDAFSFDRNTM